MLSAAQKRRLAKEARKLAMASIRTRLRFDPHNWCGCAAGRIVKRSGVRNESNALAATASAIGCLGIPISEATYRYDLGEHLALAFPLLALATELDGKVI